MELVRILSKDSRSATDEVLAKYGEDALIISNQRLNGKTELIVAVDIKPDMETNNTSLLAKPSSGNAEIQFADIFESRLSQSRSERESTGKDSVNYESNQRDHLRARELVELVREELESIKREISLAKKAGAWQQISMPNQPVKPLVDAMNNLAIPTSLKILIIDHIANEESEQKAKEKIRTWLLENIKNQVVNIPTSGVQVICGPSGAGKTTIIGKLALNAASKVGSDNIAVISYNDHRLGAWGQIQLLTAQSGVDSFRCKGLDNLKNLLEELSERETIFIDTPGVGIEETHLKLRKTFNSANFHLVLPASSSLATTEKYLKSSKNLWSSLILSKLDEGNQPWSILGALCDSNIPLSLTSSSPSIKDPMLSFSTKTFVKSVVENIETVVEESQASGLGNHPANMNPKDLEVTGDTLTSTILKHRETIHSTTI